MSAPKRPLDLSRRARNDIRNILLQSLLQWGEEQESRYAAALGRALDTIGDNPNIGRARDDLRPGLRTFSFEQHIIVYEVRDTVIWVARILHHRMDVRRAFRQRRV
jgi:toxin ParE1/3/4